MPDALGNIHLVIGNLAQVGEYAWVSFKPLEGLLDSLQAALSAFLLPKQGVQHISRGRILTDKTKTGLRQVFNGTKITRRGELASPGYGGAVCLLTFS